MSNSPSKGSALMAHPRFNLDRSTPSLWRVTFNNPPINLIDPVMIVALHDLLTKIEQLPVDGTSPRAAKLEQRVLAPLCLGESGRGGDGDRCRRDCSREPEEQEENLGVGCVGTGKVESLGAVVVHDHRPCSSELALELEDKEGLRLSFRHRAPRQIARQANPR